MSSSAARTGASGGSVTGSTIIPDSDRLTLSISATCASIERFRWTTPIPPSRASAIARRASVTVSIAAETIGIARSIERVKRARVETSFGRTCDSAGTSSTSSKVNPSRPNFRSSSSSRWTSSALSSAAACSVKTARVPSRRDEIPDKALTGRSYREPRAGPPCDCGTSRSRRLSGRWSADGAHHPQEPDRPDRGRRAGRLERGLAHGRRNAGLRRDPRALAGQARPHASSAFFRQHDLQLGPHGRTVPTRLRVQDVDRALDVARERSRPVRRSPRRPGRRAGAADREARPRERRHGQVAQQRRGIGQDARLLLGRRRVRRQARVPLGRELPAQDRGRWDPHRHADGLHVAAERGSCAATRVPANRPGASANGFVNIVDAGTGVQLAQAPVHGIPAAIGLSPHVLAVLTQRGPRDRIVWFSASTGAKLGSVLVSSHASTQIAVSDQVIVFRVYKTLRTVSTATGRIEVLANTPPTAVGLSLANNRLLWAENRGETGRLRALAVG